MSTESKSNITPARTIMLSIGILSCGRPQVLAETLTSIEKNLNLDVPHEFVLLENKGWESGPCHRLLEAFGAEKKSKQMFLPVNMGEPAMWAAFEYLAEGEYRLFIEDDTPARDRPLKLSVSTVLAYMKQQGWLIMNLVACSKFTCWPHIEHISLRLQVGDYKCFPRHYPRLQDQTTWYEPEFGQRLARAGISVGRYPEVVFQHQSKHKCSLGQTALHKMPPGLSEEAKEEVWRNFEFAKYNISPL